MMFTSNRFRFAILSLLIFLLLGSGLATAQTSSRWANPANSTDWFDALNWTNGVPPNGEGYGAQFIRLPSNNSTIQLSSPATLGRLIFFDTGQAAISGVGPLTFDGIGQTTSSILVLSRQGRQVYAAVTVPILLQPDEDFLVDTRSSTHLTLSSLVGSPSSTLTKRGDGSLTLGLETQMPLRVERGSVHFEPTANTSLQGEITLAGGDVFFSFSTEVNPTPIVISGAGGTIYANNHWTGGSSGIGNLGIGGSISIDAPLAHTGDLNTGQAELNVANSYTGNTIVSGTTILNHAGAFSTSTTPIVIDEGNLVLNVLPNGNRDYQILGGRLTVQTTAPIQSTIELEGTIHGNGIFDGPINYYSANLAGGTFNGPIRGEGELRIYTNNSEVILNGENEINGLVIIRGNATVNNANALDLSRTIVHKNGVLNLNVPASHQILTIDRVRGGSGDKLATLSFHVAQDIAAPWVVHNGWLDASEGIGFSDLILYGFDSQAGIRLQSGGSIRIDNDLRVLGTGEINGGLSGEGDIRLVGKTLSLGGDFSNCSGDIITRHGWVSVGNSLFNPNTEFHVYQGGVLGLDGEDLVIENDIYLHNAGGSLVHSYLGSLTGSGSTLRGRLFIEGQDSAISGSFLIEGSLIGENLRHRGGSLILLSPQEQLRGVLRMDRSSLKFEEAGAIRGLDTVLLENGALYMRSPETTPTTQDRIADDILIRSKGGFIKITSNSFFPITETLGTLQLEQGLTRIFASSDLNQSATLTIDNLQREPGAMLWFREADSGFSTRINNVQTFDGHMIGAWATTEDGFASINANGLVGTVATTSSNLNTAGPTDHVAISGGVTMLTSDRTIASLTYNPTGDSGDQLDLGGHQLAIASGGIFRTPEIRNGSITAGTGQPAQLVVNVGFDRISADIVDNGEQGVVSLLSIAHLELSGNNTYSGGTWVNTSELIIENRSAIPANDRLHINNGIYNLTQLTGDAIPFDEIHLTDDGRIHSNEVAINANTIFVDDGTFSVELVGDGTIVKESDGTFSIGNTSSNSNRANESPDFTGSLIIKEGTVRFTGNRTLVNATIIVEGGRLQEAHVNDISLRGGELMGGFGGTIDVQENSSLFAAGQTTTLGTLKGSADLTVHGRFDSNPFRSSVWLVGNASQFSGDFHIESGTLLVGKTESIGTGTIFVQEGARLTLGGQDVSPTVFVANDVHLYGGTIAGIPKRIDGNPGIVTGDVFVYEDAFIGVGVNLAGTTHLPSEASIYGLSDPLAAVLRLDYSFTEVSGQLLVGQNATWNLLASPLVITGAITPDTDNASIDFVGAEDILRLETTSIQLVDDRSLTILQNGVSQELGLAGADTTVSGNGTYVGDVSLGDGASISPGNSAGLLIIDGDVSLLDGSHFVVELGGTIRGEEYDALDVTGDLTLGGMLDVEFLDGYVPEIGTEFTIMQASHVDGVFDNVTENFRVGNIEMTIFYENDRVVLRSTATIPEPSSLVLLIIGFALLLKTGQFYSQAN